MYATAPPSHARRLSGALLALTCVAMPSVSPARCPDPSESVVVDAEHFEFMGYDARQGVASVRPAAEVPGAPADGPAVRLALPDQPLLMPLLPAEFEAALEARAGGLTVELLLGIRPVPGPDADGECGRYQPEVRGLRVAGATLGADAERSAAPSATPESVAPGADAAAVSPAPVEDPRVTVDALRYDPGSAHTDSQRLRRQAAHIAARCLVRAQLEGPAQGAVVMELRTSLVGQRLPPKAVVDGLVNRELSRCLVDRLFADAALWHDLPPGLQVYLPIYFRPGMARSGSTGPDDNGAKAP